MKLHVDPTGIIQQAEGDSKKVLGLEAGELIGLPLQLFSDMPLHSGLETVLCRQRTGDQVPTHFAVLPKQGGYELWVEEALGQHQERTKLEVSQCLFRSLAFSAEYGDPELVLHLRRVSEYTEFLAVRYLKAEAHDAMRYAVAALVHDIGKAAIPREILFKPARLLQEERLFMERHAEKGFAMICEIERNFRADLGWMIDTKTFTLAKEISLHHHENWDGTGYPTRSKGTDIPLSARLVKVVDVIDALLSARPYKYAWSWDKVREELERLAGVEFDPDLVEWLLEHEGEFLEVVAKGGDEICTAC